MTKQDFTAEEIEDVIDIIVDECKTMAGKNPTNSVCVGTIVCLLNKYQANTDETRALTIKAVRAANVCIATV